MPRGPRDNTPKKKKFYVVFRGMETGIFETWDECKVRVAGCRGASFSSFRSREEAEQALSIGNLAEWKSLKKERDAEKAPRGTYLAVDAACSGPPGPVEYRGVLMPDKAVAFKFGPFAGGTNNIGEFLAIAEGLRWVAEKSLSIPVYSDSACAISWTRAPGGGLCRTTLSTVGDELAMRVGKAERWLRGPDADRVLPQLRKWDTREWGEIPADFGRK